MSEREYVIIFGLDNVNTDDLVADHHPGVAKLLNTLKPVRLTSSSYLIRSEDGPHAIISKFTPFLKRGEEVYVFAVNLESIEDWNVLSSDPVVDALAMGIDPPADFNRLETSWPDEVRQG